MSERGFDEILTDLEKTIAILSDGSAPLEVLVAAHQRASRLLSDAQAALARLKARAEETAKSLAD